jgi:hypothetical protein
MSGNVDLHKAIVSVWDSQNLDSNFTTYWDSGETSLSLVLHDGTATPGQPMPYCVLEIGPSFTMVRMSSGAETINEVRDVPVRFIVHMRQKTSVTSKSPKQVVSELVNEIMKVFGGHPTVKPQSLNLDNGCHLVTTYENDYGVRTGEDEYSWLLAYRVKVDVPVQALSA